MITFAFHWGWTIKDMGKLPPDLPTKRWTKSPN
jgi:hypothetical protein